MTARVRDLEKRLEKEPGNLGLRVALAGALHEQGRVREAIELYRSVAIAYREAGRTQQAIAVCKSILELAPDDAIVRAMLLALAPVSAVERSSERSAPMSVVERASERSAPHERASAADVTPLPAPLPHHEADPTTRKRRLDTPTPDTEVDELPAVEGATTRPGNEARKSVSGLATAARRIAGMIAGEADKVDKAEEIPTDEEVTDPRDGPQEEETNDRTGKRNKKS